MQRLLPAFLAVLLVAPGCTQFGLPGAPGGQVSDNSNLTTVAPLTAQEAALRTKEGLASLNAALASLRDLKSSSAAAPRGTVADLQQAAAGYRLLAAQSVADDELPDDSYTELEWFHEVVGEPTIEETETEYVLSQRITEEGRIDGVAVEHYETTLTTRIPKAGYTPDPGADQELDFGDIVGGWGSLAGGSYTRDEVVTASEFRKLGRYVTAGSMTMVGDKAAVEASQAFTPKDATTTQHITFKSTFDEGKITLTVKGDAPGGGTIDLTSVVAFAMSEGSTTTTFSQQGTIVTAKGETIVVNCSLDMVNAMASYSSKGELKLDFKGKLVLKLTMDQSTAGGDKSGGAIFAADGTTKLGDIAMSASNPEGTVTFTDGTTQAINLSTVADLMNVANSVSL